MPPFNVCVLGKGTCSVPLEKGPVLCDTIYCMCPGKRDLSCVPPFTVGVLGKEVSFVKCVILVIISSDFLAINDNYDDDNN